MIYDVINLLVVLIEKLAKNSCKEFIVSNKPLCKKDSGKKIETKLYQSLKLLLSLAITLKEVLMRMIVGMKNTSVSYLILLILLIKILCIFNEAIHKHGSFCQIMNE